MGNQVSEGGRTALWAPQPSPTALGEHRMSQPANPAQRPPGPGVQGLPWNHAEVGRSHSCLTWANSQRPVEHAP